jgi:BirA family biotin operon repressor/biotin-[acetyl-CoA-carboxylase] ligase
LGIGINLTPPQDGFPPELADRAGALFDSSKERFLRERMTVAFFKHLEKRLQSPAGVYAAYRSHLLFVGQTVLLANTPVTVSELLPDFRLAVTLPDGSVKYLAGGEISLQIS